MSKFTEIEIGTTKDWKFGIVTREVTRIDEDFYQIDDTSSGWHSAYIDGETLEKLIAGDMDLIELVWI